MNLTNQLVLYSATNSLPTVPDGILNAAYLLTVPELVRQKMHFYLNEQGLCKLAEVNKEYQKFASQNVSWKDQFKWKFGNLTEKEKIEDRNDKTGWKKKFECESSFERLQKKINDNKIRIPLLIVNKEGVFNLVEKDTFLRKGNFFQKLVKRVSYQTGYLNHSTFKKLKKYTEQRFKDQEELYQQLDKNVSQMKFLLGKKG